MSFLCKSRPLLLQNRFRIGSSSNARHYIKKVPKDQGSWYQKLDAVVCYTGGVAIYLYSRWVGDVLPVWGDLEPKLQLVTPLPPLAILWGICIYLSNIQRGPQFTLFTWALSAPTMMGVGVYITFLLARTVEYIKNKPPEQTS